MALFPLCSNFEGDFVIQIFSADTENTMAEVAEAAAVHSINRRVRPQPGKILRIRRHGEKEFFPLDMKLVDSGLKPTETIDIIFSDS